MAWNIVSILTCSVLLSSFGCALSLGARRARSSDSHQQLVVRVHKRERMTRALHHAIHTDQLGPSADESRAETERSAFSAVAI